MGGRRKSYNRQLREHHAAQDVLEKEFRKDYFADLQTKVDAGELSKETFLEIQNRSSFSRANAHAFNEVVEAEVSGTSAKGKSRLGTQKLFEALIDKPGRRQTLLQPRSNSSRGMLGV